MPPFLRLAPPIEALQTFLRKLPQNELGIESIETLKSLGRVLASDVIASHPLPEFSRSSVDGYAVQARDTYGTSDASPGYLSLIGEVLMGGRPEFIVTQGTCALIHTGGMIPEGADAVVMLEYTQIIDGRKTYKGLIGERQQEASNEIEILHPVAEEENILRIGEDVSRNERVLVAGRRIRPAEIGGCMALGVTKLRVTTKPKVGILSSGDEVISPENSTLPGQVRDVNSYSLAALVEEAGGEPVIFGIVPDNLKYLKNASSKALSECDALLITAGSSASSRDITAEVISALGKPGILVHGINIRPGKPTILAVCDGKAVIGLPGNPVSALVIGGLFVTPVIEQLLGIRTIQLKPSLPARLMVNLPSESGREDWVAVKILINKQRKSNNADIQYLAEPVFGKSNLIFTLAKADGLVRIPPDASGISAGEIVDAVIL